MSVNEKILNAEVCFSEFDEDKYLLSEAQKRIQNNISRKSLSFEEVLQHYGISESYIENAENFEIE